MIDDWPARALRGIKKNGTRKACRFV